jgi:hypothetical protein
MSVHRGSITYEIKLIGNSPVPTDSLGEQSELEDGGDMFLQNVG